MEDVGMDRDAGEGEDFLRAKRTVTSVLAPYSPSGTGWLSASMISAMTRSS